MENKKYTIEEFGAIVKQKYPAYAAYSDSEIGKKTLEKYPEYSDRIVQPESNYFQRVGGNIASDISTRAERVGNILNRPDTGITTKAVQAIGQGAGAAANVMEQPIAQLPGIKQGLEAAGAGINWLATSEWSPIKHLGDLIGENKALQEVVKIYDTDPNFKDSVDAVANIVRLGGDITAAKDAVDWSKNVVSKINKYSELQKEFTGVGGTPGAGGAKNTIATYDKYIASGDYPATQVYQDIAKKIYTPEVATQILGDVKDFLKLHGYPELIPKLESAVDINNMTAQSILKAEKAIVPSTLKGVLKTVTETIPSNVPTLSELGTAGTRVAETAKNILGPKPLTPTKAVGQVLQGTEKDVATGIKAFSTLDTTGVKTYADLSKVMDNKIKELSQVVDKDLAADPTPLKVQQLVTKTKVGNEIIAHNFVLDAVNNLEELYSKTKDIANLKKIQNIKAKLDPIKGVGLTRKEVNQLARDYGIEFGEKGFSKVTGEPLTTVNAQAFENTRSALKDVARSGIKGKEAQIADAQMSAIYRARDLVNANAKAVNKLQQKIQERGLAEKVGYLVSKYADVLSGGSIRGFVGGILPRGAGYKTLNALDLEENLSNNLKIIQDAINAKTDEETVKILQKLNPSATE